jgi:opacity protein-like surface antigen
MKVSSLGTLVLALGTSCVATTVGAANPLGIYVGAGIGESEIRNDGGFLGADYQYDEHETGWQAIAGIRPISPLGFELEYIDFGRASARTNNYCVSSSVDAKATTLFGVGYLPLPIPFLDIYGKLGVARLQSNTTGVRNGCIPDTPYCSGFGAPFRQDSSSTNFTYGAGVQTKFYDFAVRAEYERISASNGSPDILSLSVTWTF